MPRQLAELLLDCVRMPWSIVAIAAAMLCCGIDARAEGGGYGEMVRLFVDQHLELPGNAEIEVAVGEVDPHLALAPCQRAEPFLPGGARLMGRTSIGVRCVEGANWSVYLPVRIRLLMDAMVASRPIGRGQPVTLADVRVDRVDVAPLRGSAILANEWVDGKVAARPLAPGEALRRDWLKAPPVVAAGEQVAVIAIGPGFAAQTSGKALGAASEGDNVQVAMANGRVLSGVARAPHTVEIR